MQVSRLIKVEWQGKAQDPIPNAQEKAQEKAKIPTRKQSLHTKEKHFKAETELGEDGTATYDRVPRFTLSAMPTEEDLRRKISECGPEEKAFDFVITDNVEEYWTVIFSHFTNFKWIIQKKPAIIGPNFEKFTVGQAQIFYLDEWNSEKRNENGSKNTGIRANLAEVRRNSAIKYNIEMIRSVQFGKRD